MMKHTPSCQTCRVVSNTVLDAVEKLANATLRMIDLGGTRNDILFDTTTLEVQRLRNECETARVELQRHREEHKLADHKRPN